MIDDIKKIHNDKWLNYDDFVNIIDCWNDTEEKIAKIIKADWYKLSQFAKNAVRHYINTWEINKNLFFKQP